MKSTRNLILGFVGGVVFLIGCDLSTDSGVTNKVVAATESLWENVGTTIYYTAGNVGIGTDTPEVNLQIESNQDSLTGLVLLNSSDGTSASTRVALGEEFNSGSTLVSNGGRIAYHNHSYTEYPDFAGFFDVLGASLSNGLMLRTSANSGVIKFLTKLDQERMRIDSSGNVGIGNTSPVSKLAVSGLPTSAPDNSGNAGVVCVTNDGNFWLDSDGTADCN